MKSTILIVDQELIGRAIKRGDRNLNMHARADRCRPPVWWIAHHNLRHFEDEAEAVEKYQNRGVEKLRDECKHQRVKIPDLSHLRLDELREREILVRLRMTFAMTVQSNLSQYTECCCEPKSHLVRVRWIC